MFGSMCKGVKVLCCCLPARATWSLPMGLMLSAGQERRSKQRLKLCSRVACGSCRAASSHSVPAIGMFLGAMPVNQR
jgi:hypothetical protein